MLNYPYIQTLNKNTWLALATIDINNTNTVFDNLYSINDNNILKKSLKHQRQKKGVRELLVKLLSYLNIQDELDESQFPYRLKQTGYYVCFSHSDNCVGVIVGKKNVAIDIEVNTVSWQVAQRFFHQNEIAQLALISKEERLLLCRWLWQLKECVVKLNQTTLVFGLQEDFSDCIGDLLSFLYIKATPFVIKKENLTYQVQLFTNHHTLIVYH